MSPPTSGNILASEDSPDERERQEVIQVQILPQNVCTPERNPPPDLYRVVSAIIHIDFDKGFGNPELFHFDMIRILRFSTTIFSFY